MWAVLAVETAETQVGEEEINPILPVWNEAFYTVIFFAILFVLVKYVLLPPVQRTMDDRAERIRSNREAADVARSQAGTVVSDFDDQLADARAEASVIIDAARAEAEAERQSIIGAVEAEISTRREASQAEIAAAKAQALAQLKPQVVTLAVNAASRVIDRPLDPSAQQPIVDRYLDSVN
jgi:F-type H+-transporting ATPase subunit b